MFKLRLPKIKRKEDKRPKVVVKVQRPTFGTPKPWYDRFMPRFKQRTSSPKVIRLGEQVRRDRTRDQRMGRLRIIASFITGKMRVGLMMLGGLLIIIVLGLAAYGLHTSEVFILKDIEVKGNRQVDDLQIVSELSDLIGRGMFTFNAATLEANLIAKYPYLKEVSIRKFLPGKLEVKVVERFPVMAYINLSGVYLVDEEAVVVDVLAVDSVAELTPEESIVIQGYGDPNAQYVYERYRAGIEDEEERDGIKWEEVDLQLKIDTLSKYRDELLARVESLVGKYAETLAASQFATLPRVDSFTAENYNRGQRFDSDVFGISLSVLTYLQEQQLVFGRLRWQSEFTIVAELAGGTRILFSSTRSIDDQIFALETIRAHGDLSGATTVDLRSELVAVR